MAQGLPAVFGEVADKGEEDFRLFMSYENAFDIPVETIKEQVDKAVYHYCPSLELVRAWIKQERLAIEDEGKWKWHQHLIARKR